MCAELRKAFHLAIGGSLTHGEGERQLTPSPMSLLKRKGVGVADLMFTTGRGMGLVVDLLFTTLC